MVNEEKRRFLRFLIASTFLILIYLLLGRRDVHDLQDIFSTSGERVSVRVEDGALVVE